MPKSKTLVAYTLYGAVTVASLVVRPEPAHPDDPPTPPPTYLDLRETRIGGSTSTSDDGSTTARIGLLYVSKYPGKAVVVFRRQRST